MAITNRDFNLATIWGSGAETTIPGTPAQGTAYRNTAADFSPGFQFLSKSPSEIANQFMWVTAKTIAQLQTQGTLSYLSTTTYAKGALCYVVDDGGTVGQYVALRSNTGQNPITSPSDWAPIAPVVTWNTKESTGACSIGDLQLRWGVILIPSGLGHNTEANATFSNPFSNYCFVLLTTPVNSEQREANGGVAWTYKDKDGFRYTAVSETLKGLNYFALGY